jgi:hypothetical protein
MAINADERRRRHAARVQSETAALQLVADVRLARAAAQLMQEAYAFLVEHIHLAGPRIMSRHRWLRGRAWIPPWISEKRRQSLESLTWLIECPDLISLVTNLFEAGLITVDALDMFLAHTPLAPDLRGKFLTARRRYHAKQNDDAERVELLELLADPTRWPGNWDQLKAAYASRKLRQLLDAGLINSTTWYALELSGFVPAPIVQTIVRVPRQAPTVANGPAAALAGSR